MELPIVHVPQVKGHRSVQYNERYERTVNNLLAQLYHHAHICHPTGELAHNTITASHSRCILPDQIPMQW